MTEPARDPDADPARAPDADPATDPDGADVARRRRIFHHLLADTLGVSVTHVTVWCAVTFFVYLETRSVFATGIVPGLPHPHRAVRAVVRQPVDPAAARIARCVQRRR